MGCLLSFVQHAQLMMWLALVRTDTTIDSRCTSELTQTLDKTAVTGCCGLTHDCTCRLLDLSTPLYKRDIEFSDAGLANLAGELTCI